jgi:hypothetical protein
MAIYVSGLGVLAPPKLYVDEEHLRQAIGNKAAAVAIMSPSDFLDLTVTDYAHKQRIIAEAKPLAFYNELAQAHKILLAPTLKVDITQEKGRVQEHEGRHRAAAFLKAGGTDFPVFIEPADGYYAIRKISDDEHRYGRLIRLSDLPTTFHGQFNKFISRAPNKINMIPENMR